MRKAVIISKTSQRRLDALVMKAQVAKIVMRMLAGGRGKVWSVTPTFLSLENYPPPMRELASKSEATGWHLYAWRLSIKRIGRTIPDEVAERKIAEMIEIGQAAANSSSWEFPKAEALSKAPVLPTTVDGEEPIGENSGAAPVSEPVYQTFSMSTDLGSHFDHIYDREAQIAVVNSAVRAFVESDYANRFHCVLYGEPACGKTEILRSFSRMLGTDSVLEFDATSTTKAGAERILLESAKLPPVLMCEEIEKTAEESLRWLLGILDHRGEVRKVTHGGGLRQREVKMLCIATVNDLSLFKRVMDGALASRFSHKIYCPRPTKEVLHKILAREIAKVSGREEWIQPAVDWCVDVEGTNDPRRVTTVCLSGKDSLLTGEYQKLLLKVSEPTGDESPNRKTANTLISGYARR